MYTNILNNFNCKEFDEALISLAKKCIRYIKNSKISLVNNKIDGSPLTKADMHVNEIICESLVQLFPKIKIISEEHKFSLDSYLDECYWIIDPIDGTRSYLYGGDEYTVNISLIYKGQPYIGLIAHPPTENIWYAKEKELVIIKKDLENISKKNKNEITIITSKEKNIEIKNFLRQYNKYKRMEISSSLKFCMLAEKKADLYPRFSNISKWDIAAGHAILNAAGGKLLNLNGKDIIYNSKSSRTEKFIGFASVKLSNSYNFKKTY